MAVMPLTYSWIAAVVLTPCRLTTSGAPGASAAGTWRRYVRSSSVQVKSPSPSSSQPAGATGAQDAPSSGAASSSPGASSEAPAAPSSSAAASSSPGGSPLPALVVGRRVVAPLHAVVDRAVVAGRRRARARGQGGDDDDDPDDGVEDAHGATVERTAAIAIGRRREGRPPSASVRRPRSRASVRRRTSAERPRIKRARRPPARR
jgi:hypothetical protein